MDAFQLTDKAYLKTVAFKISDNQKMVDFYKNVVGFILKSEENGLSIFGTSEKKNQMLILEENHAQENHPSVHFSFGVPSSEALSKMSKRFSDHGYPLKSQSEQQLSFVDPEDNHILVHIHDELKEIEQPMAARKDEDPTALPVDYSNKLPENSRLTKVCINTLDSDGSVTFYDKVLGLTPAGERNFTLDQADLRLCDEAEEGAASDLGWSFFTVNVQSSQAIEALMVHLEQLGHEFFVDNKRSILSLFDQNGIEWWFTKK